MTNEQILKKAIEKAVRNGWGMMGGWKKFEIILAGVGFWDSKEKHFAHQGGGEKYSVEEIIFSHDFAKAFFPNHGGMSFISHLQCMVSLKNPIKYLKEFL